jgi:two-component system, LuxR family, sensor kinase FixL
MISSDTGRMSELAAIAWIGRRDALGSDETAVKDRRLFEVADQSRVAGMDAIGAALSHELNQPLTALVIYLQSLQRQTRLQPGAVSSAIEEIAGKALREAERATEIVRRMRRLSLRAEPDRRPIDLNALARETLEIAFMGVTRRPAIDQRLTTALPAISGDPVQIRQVMVNLLRNAAEATEKVARPRIVIATEAADGVANFTVGDNGPGIDPKIEGRLFRAFETSKPQGQGLGLAISRMIAQNHGGDLVVRSKAGERGAMFSLKLPLK